jgi:tetratricopeptide (TPR) repeat protein
MSSVDDLHKAKKGADLKALAYFGNHEAAMAFSNLVFNGKYDGDLTAHKTKKAAKEEAIDDSVELVVTAAEADFLPAIKEAADMYFEGRREPGNYGETIVSPSYKKAIFYFKKLVEQKNIDQIDVGKTWYQLGMATLFRKRIKRNKDLADVYDYWLKALAFGGNSAVLAALCLSENYWADGKYDRAVELAQGIVNDHPYANLIICEAHKKGLGGLEQSDDEARRYYQLWFQQTAKKKA